MWTSWRPRRQLLPAANVQDRLEAAGRRSKGRGRKSEAGRRQRAEAVSGAKPAQHVGEGRDAGGAGVGAGRGHAGSSEAGGAGIAAAGKGEDEAVAATAVTAG